jgi:SPP1 family predicted phage head-tail adaptor
MQIGRLDRRITIERATTAANDFNEPVQTWATLTEVWAHAAPVMDAEKVRAGETLALKSYRFTIRYSAIVADVDPRDRLTFDGRTFDIAGVKEIGRRQGLEITATARAESP